MQERDEHELRTVAPWAILSRVSSIQAAAVDCYVNNPSYEKLACILEVMANAEAAVRDCCKDDNGDPPGCGAGYKKNEDGDCVPIGS